MTASFTLTGQPFTAARIHRKPGSPPLTYHDEVVDGREMAVLPAESGTAKLVLPNGYFVIVPATDINDQTFELVRTIDQDEADRVACLTNRAELFPGYRLPVGMGSKLMRTGMPLSRDNSLIPCNEPLTVASIVGNTRQLQAASGQIYTLDFRYLTDKFFCIAR